MSELNKAVVEKYFKKLFPIMRSITGDGVRETHDIIREVIPIETMEVPTGYKCYDWEVPREWKFNDAYVIDPDGNKIFDAKKNNLRLVNYSVPFSGEMELEEFKKHIHTAHNCIPYKTAYYKEGWGFCCSKEKYDNFKDGTYKIVVDTELFNGSMTISDLVIKGRTEDEILISTYTCHPSLANNELSGPLVAMFLAKEIMRLGGEHKHTYRFVFLPETIGALAYSHMGKLSKIIGGYELTCLGMGKTINYKNALEAGFIDKCAHYAIKQAFKNKIIKDMEVFNFFPRGANERQYNLLGFKVGTFMRDIPERYETYHSSLDCRLDYEYIVNTVEMLMLTVNALSKNVKINHDCMGEPMLSKYGLYPPVATEEKKLAYNYILCNKGKMLLDDVHFQTHMPLDFLYEAWLDLVKAGICL